MIGPKQSRIVRLDAPIQSDGENEAALPPSDFVDVESQRVLSSAAHAVARELGRDAARDYFASILSLLKVS